MIKFTQKTNKRMVKIWRGGRYNELLTRTNKRLETKRGLAKWIRIQSRSS